MQAHWLHAPCLASPQPQPVEQLRRSRQLRARRSQLLPPLGCGFVRARRGLEHILEHVGSGLVRAQQLLRPLRLFDRVVDDRMGMVLASMTDNHAISQPRVSECVRI